MSFAKLGLSEPILRALSEKGYVTPTQIQEQAIPQVLSRKDVLASAQTGTGKTASFTLPLLHRLATMQRMPANSVRVLVLTPTRELAAQVHDSVVQYGRYLKVRSTVVFGGVKINPQMMKLRGGVELVVATPGRLIDLINQRALRLDQVDTLVLDEADRMLDMGFIHDIKKIMALVPKSRQTLLFSATFSPEICQLAKMFLNQPVELSVTPRNATAVSVSQVVHPVDKSRKVALLSHLLRNKDWAQALVFSRTKHGANKLVKMLALDGIESAAIHGNKSQSQRTKALADFKDGKLHVLVATDIAARGIDIDQLPVVVNFDLPDVPEDYVHRIGRTGRAGSVGCAVSLVCADEIRQLLAIEKVIKSSLKRVELEDFYPEHKVPMTVSSRTPEKTRLSKPTGYNSTRGRSTTDRNSKKSPRVAYGRGRS